VLEADAAVTVIDFEGFRAGLPYQDVARFLVHLDLALARPWLMHCAQRARGEFLAGYRADDDFDPGLWTLCLGAESLAVLARNVSHAQGAGGPLAQWKARRVVQCLERALAGGASAR
jgi:hypothetical protein